MAVFQEGLAASTNRLQAAWEGLYTSWSKSATIISKLIDAMASLVSTLADIGTLGSGAVAVFLSLAISTGATALASNLHAMSVNKEAKTMKDYLAVSSTTTKQNIALAASQALVIAQYVILAAAIVAVTYLIIRRINYEKEYIKLQEKEAQQASQLAAKTKDQASSLGVLITELEDAKRVGEDITSIKQKIIDQFGDEISAIELEGKSVEELIGILKKLQVQKEGLAAKEYIQAAKDREEADFLNSEAFKNANVKVKEVKEEKAGMDKWGRWIYKTVFDYNGKTYSTIDELKKVILNEIDNSSNLTEGEKSFITKAIIAAIILFFMGISNTSPGT